MLNKTKVTTYVLVISILLSAIFVFYMDCQKKNYHIDETYSYILSNSHDADKLGNSSLLWERWISAEEWREFITVQDGESFDYATVYRNNTTDAHPPLFYWCLHTICSLFPDSFSMWYGLGINLVFFILSLVVLYLISRRVIKNAWFAVLPVILYGLSPTAVDTAMFIRMYSLLTFLNLLSVLMHLKMYQDGQNAKLLTITFLITFLGAITQYYFVVSAFCISAAYCIYRFVKKEYRQMMIYGALELLAIILLFITYPAAISQITGSSTNNIGNEVAATIFTLSGWLITILRYCYGVLVNWGRGLLAIKVFATVLLLVSLLVLICAKVFNKKSSHVASEKGEGHLKDLLKIVAYGMVSVAVVVIISKMSYRFVYIRYLYHMIPLFIVVAVMFAEWLTVSLMLSKKAVICILIAFSLANAAGTISANSVDYLFETTQENYDSLLEEYGDIPVVLLCEKETYVLTANYHFLKNYSNTYVMSADSDSGIDDVLQEKAVESGILLMVWCDKYWGNGYETSDVISDVQSECTLFKNYEYLQYLNFCDIYYLN